MKKQLIIILLLSISVFANAQSAQKVELESITNTTHNPRSLVQKPIVYVDDVACQLSIKFGSSDFYTVFVFDQSGAVVYQSDVISDGNNHVYALPELELGSYTVSIRGSKNSFEGDFTL